MGRGTSFVHKLKPTFGNHRLQTLGLRGPKRLSICWILVCLIGALQAGRFAQIGAKGLGVKRPPFRVTCLAPMKRDKNQEY